MQGSIYLTSGKVERGVLDGLAFDGDAMTDLEITSGKIVRQANQQFAILKLTRRGLHVRRVDGNAIEQFALRWHSSSEKKEPFERVWEGEVDITVMDDFAPVLAAISQLEFSSRRGNSDALSSLPFRRAAIMPALFAPLGRAVQPWCCLEAASMLPPRLETDAPATTSRQDR